jgi:hypothetical protein
VVLVRFGFWGLASFIWFRLEILFDSLLDMVSDGIRMSVLLIKQLRRFDFTVASRKPFQCLLF